MSDDNPIIDDVLWRIEQYAPQGDPDAQAAAVVMAVKLKLYKAGYAAAGDAARDAALRAMPPSVYEHYHIELAPKVLRWRRIEQISIDNLEISVRVERALRHLGVKTVGDLVKLTPVDLVHQPNFGKRSLAQVEDILSDLGLKLRPVP